MSLEELWSASYIMELLYSTVCQGFAYILNTYIALYIYIQWPIFQEELFIKHK